MDLANPFGFRNVCFLGFFVYLLKRCRLKRCPSAEVVAVVLDGVFQTLIEAFWLSENRDNVRIYAHICRVTSVTLGVVVTAYQHF